MNFTAWKYSRLIALILIINHPLLAEEDKTVIFKNDAKYSGTDDTYVKKGSSFSGGMSNFGACETMLINETTKVGLIRFDVSSLFKKYKKIISITLRIFSKNAPKDGSIKVHRLSIANSGWREGGSCGSPQIGKNRHEVTWMHLADYGGFPLPPPSWASRTAGPTSPGVDFDKVVLGSNKNSASQMKGPFDINFKGDLTALIDDWSLASPIIKLKDKGENPCWTADWNWSQPAAETANEGLLLKGSDGTIHEFYTSETKDLSLRPQLIIKYKPREK